MPWIAKTLQEVADFFGVQYDTVRKDWRERGMPGENGRYDLSVITQWKFARLRQQAEQHTESDLETKKLFEEVRYKKLKNDERERLLIERAAILQEIAILLARIADRVQAVPDEIEMEIPSEVRSQVKARIAEKFNLILKEMSEWTL